MDGGHDVMGYRVEYTTEGSDGEPVGGTAWMGIDTNLEDDATARTDPPTANHTPMTMTSTSHTWMPLSGNLGAEDREPLLTAGSVRWFRVIAITYENDGYVDTGGTEVVLDTGAMALTRDEEASPGDTDAADPKRGVTDGLGDAPADEDPEDPDRPMDLTAEAASDSNDLADDDRGIFLTWNAVARAGDATASETDFYVVERKRSNTGVDVLDDDDWVEIDRVYSITSYTDDDRLRRTTEMRAYRVGSVATGIDDPTYSDPMETGVAYALHPPMHMPSMPQMVTAAADSDTEISVSWLTPADNGGSAITGFTVRWKQSDATSYAAANMVTADATASSHMVTGLMAGTSYTFQVRATNAEGDSYWSMYAMAMTDAAVTELTAPSDVMATVGVTDPGAITVTWTPGENATEGHLVLLFNSDFTEVPHVGVPTGEGMYTIPDVTTAGDYVVVVVSVKSRSRSTCTTMPVVNVP